MSPRLVSEEYNLREPIAIQQMTGREERAHEIAADETYLSLLICGDMARAKKHKKGVGT